MIKQDSWRGKPLIIYVLNKPTNARQPDANFKTEEFMKHYTQLKVKDAKATTVHMLANDPEILTKISGWKFQKLSSQMKTIAEEQHALTNRLDSTLEQLLKIKTPDEQLSHVIALLKENRDKTRKIAEQLKTALSQGVDMVEQHKPLVQGIVLKYKKRK